MKKYKLSDLFYMQMGKTPARNISAYWDGGSHPWISISDMTSNGRFITETRETITDKAVFETGIKPIFPGTVIMSFKLSVGKVAQTTVKAYSNEAIMAFDIRDDLLSSGIGLTNDYAYYLLSSLNFDNVGNKAVMGKTLNKEILSNTEVYLHNWETQKKIVATLEKVDNLISLRKRQLSKLDELVKSRFIELFGDIDECQNKLELQNICEKITDGSHNPPAGVEKSQNYMISSQNIHDNIIDYKDVRYLSDSDFENENKRTAIMPGDVLLTIVGAIGRSAVVKDDLNITCQRSVCVIHPNRDKVNSIFLKYMLDSISDKIINEARGAAQKGIYLNQVKKLQIICPSFNLQTQFAAFVEQTDKSKLEIKKSLEKLETLKKALMQKYFG